MPTPAEVQQQRLMRSRFLAVLYDMAAKSRRSKGYVEVRDLVPAAAPGGLEDGEIARLIRELSNSGLIEVPRNSQTLQESYPRLVCLTAFGSDEVERWVEQGDQPTSEIPVAYNVVYNATNVHTAYGSQFMTGSTGTTINIQNQFGADLSTIASNLRQIIGTAPLSEEERDELEDDVSTLDEQASTSTPNTSRLKSALRRVGRFLGRISEAGQAGMAAGLTAETQQLVSHVFNQLPN